MPTSKKKKKAKDTLTGSGEGKEGILGEWQERRDLSQGWGGGWSYLAPKQGWHGWGGDKAF